MLGVYNYKTHDGKIISYIDNMVCDKKTIVFLHGWGADKDNLRGIYNNLTDEYRIISIDIPGFGGSTPPDEVWGSYEYAEVIFSFIKALGITKFSLIGHSFGGKIASIISYRYPDFVEKLVLIAASCLRNKRNISWYMKVISYKVMKYFVKNILGRGDILESLKNSFGSDDYKQSKDLRDILVKVVNEDLTHVMSELKIPVFLYWGSKDDSTPVWMAKKLQKVIPDVGLYIVKDGTHYPFLEDNSIVSIIKSFI